MGWSWTVFVVIVCECLGLGGEKGQNCNSTIQVAYKEIGIVFIYISDGRVDNP